MTGWTEDGLLKSWRALSRRDADADWQFVHLTDTGPVGIEAGCHFPGAREALIVSFPCSVLADGRGLPEGLGFDVIAIRNAPEFAGRSAIALVRRMEGSLDIFAIMATDVLRALGAARDQKSQDLARIFVGRVTEWQAFMARKRRPLSPQAQLGLAGELRFLERLCDLVPETQAIDLWKGPLHAAQDFHVGPGAVEVKSALSGETFLARINSIEQLDTDLSPLFLVTTRFAVGDDGISLPDQVAALRRRMAQADMVRAFDALLLLAGYDDDHADHYRRLLREIETLAHLVGPDFPCLRRATLPGPVRKALYTLDIDAIDQPPLQLDDIFRTFGLIQ